MKGQEEKGFDERRDRDEGRADEEKKSRGCKDEGRWTIYDIGGGSGTMERGIRGIKGDREWEANNRERMWSDSRTRTSSGIWRTRVKVRGGASGRSGTRTRMRG